MTSSWCNISGYFVADSNWSCLLIYASEVHWRMQPTAARRSGTFSEMHGALRSLHVSAAVSMRTNRKWLERNIGHLMTIQIWMAWRYRVWGVEWRTKLLWNLHPKPIIVSEWKVALEKIWRQFSADPIINSAFKIWLFHYCSLYLLMT